MSSFVVWFGLCCDCVGLVLVRRFGCAGGYVVHFLLRCCVGGGRCCYGFGVVWILVLLFVVDGFAVVWVLVVGLRCWLLLDADFGGCVQLRWFGVLSFVVFVGLVL